MQMHFGVNSKMALETVREHKTRSFLTVLGVVIGVAAMIFVASILVGISRDMQGFLEDYGTNTLFVFRFDIGIRTGRMTAEERNRKPLTLEDAQAILAECPHVKNVTVEVQPRVDFDVRPVPQVARYGTHEIRESGLHRHQLRPIRRSTTRTSRRAAFSPTSKTYTVKTSPSSAPKSTRTSSPRMTASAKPFSSAAFPIRSSGCWKNARVSSSKTRPPIARSRFPTTPIASTIPPTTSTSSAPRRIPASRMLPKTRFAACCAAAATCPSTSPTTSASAAPKPSPKTSARS